MQILVLSGPIGVGKSSFADALQKLFGVTRVSTRAWLLQREGAKDDRAWLQDSGARLDNETNGRWVVEVLESALGSKAADVLLFDAARTIEQIQSLRDRWGDCVFHVHLRAEAEELERRYAGRQTSLREFSSYAQARAHGTEAKVHELADVADVVLETDYSCAETLAVTVMAMLGRDIPPIERLVDVVVGGQYGSEGKGNICAAIANDYAALVRIGGPNAGHRVFDPPYKFVQLPSGTGSNPDAKILIAAGSTLWLPTLLKEIIDHALTNRRLSIDPQAMVIDDADRRAEEELASIATTKQGVGAAAARKIANRGKGAMFGPPVRLVRDVPELADYVSDVREVLDSVYREGGRVLVEGTQGTALSIHHGPYPWVTSRETSSSGCLSDAGISHLRVRDVIMVVRTLPIRVGGTSGYMGKEITWEEVSTRSGIPENELKEAEKGTVSGRLRRIADFDWGQLRRATELNGATMIALTFVDYLGAANRGARDFASLNPEALNFIRRVEAVTGLKVGLISKAFAADGVLRRGNWQ